MSDLTLTPAPFLGGYSASSGGADLVEVTDLALVSLAVPADGRATLDAKMEAAFGAGFPAPGTAVQGRDGHTRLLGLAPDQALVVLPRPANGAALATIMTKLDGAAWCTEQSDNWVVLRLSGPNAVAAFAALCAVDLHPAAFPEGRVARTVVEHLGGIVLREAEGSLLLMSASSSARSFLHTLDVALSSQA